MKSKIPKNIKKLLLATLLIVAVLGFISHGTQSGCSTNFENTCGAIGGSIEMALHHLLEIENLMPAIMNSNMSPVLLVIIFTGLFIATVFLRKKSNSIVFFRRIRKKNTELIFIWKIRFLRWLNFHYKRDPYTL